MQDTAADFPGATLLCHPLETALLSSPALAAALLVDFLEKAPRQVPFWEAKALFPTRHQNNHHTKAEI